MTQLQPSDPTPAHSDPSFPTPIHNPISPNYRQYRHGPGILILDTHAWIIATWDRDQLAGGSNGAYVITADMGILELHVGGGGDGSVSGDIARKIEELSYLGTIYSMGSFLGQD